MDIFCENCKIEENLMSINPLMDNEEEKPRQLTEKQRRFVERYCVHFNGSRACREAGYSEGNSREQAYENMTKPYIIDAINAKLKLLSMSAEEATKRLTDMGRGSIESFLDIDENGRTVIDLSTEEARENLGLIKKIKQIKKEFSDGAIIEITNEIELHDSKDAILNLLKMHGKFNLKTETELTIREQPLFPDLKNVIRKNNSNT